MTQIKQDGARELLLCAIDLSTPDSTEPRYKIIGEGVAEAPLEIAYEKKEGGDIRGNYNTRYTSRRFTQTFSAFEITDEPRGELYGLVHEYAWDKKKLKNLSKFNGLLITAFLDKEGSATYTAKHFDGVSIETNGLNGTDFLTTDLVIAFGGKETDGTVQSINDEDELIFVPKGPSA